MLLFQFLFMLITTFHVHINLWLKRVLWFIIADLPISLYPMFTIFNVKILLECANIQYRQHPQRC